MKKFYSLLLACCFMIFSIFIGGCYLTNAQKMKHIQGTYLLKSYTTTEKHYENIKESDKIITTVTNEIEERGLVTYLVVTGNNRGYYVTKEKGIPTYAREVELQYEGSTEEQNKYSYVAHKAASSSEWTRMGVTRDSLNEARPAICFKGLITNAEVSTSGFDRYWTKVDSATDLSYVQAQLGSFPVYGLEEYEVQGGYITSFSYDVTTPPTDTAFTPSYYYYFFILDTHNMQATTYFAERNGEPQEKTSSIVLLQDDWSQIQIGEDVWTRSSFGYGYTRTVEAAEDGIAYTISASRCYSFHESAQLEERVHEAIEAMRQAQENEQQTAEDESPAEE